MKNNRRYIEESFPVKEVSVESAREKNIRHGHISTLHIWWARRPLASSRATAYASLIPAIDPKKDPDAWQKERDFIIEFSKWENSNRPDLIERARKRILEANGGVPPKVLDPFGGGGSIPLECLRLGCETYSNDLNPVAVLIQKCTLEYPQKYGKPGWVDADSEGDADGEPKKKGKQLNMAFKDGEGKCKVIDGKKKKWVENVLLHDVRKWGNWVLEEAKKEIGRFYPADEDGSIPVGYLWARTIPCQNPSCGAKIPLMRQYWLAKKDKKKVSLYPYVESGKVNFKIVGTGYEEMPKGFDPEAGTVDRAVATCPICGSVIEADDTRRLFFEGKSDQKMIAVVLHKPGEQGKRYRLATEKDMQIFLHAEEYLKKKREELMVEWGMDPVPDELLPPKETLGFRVQRYGILKWGDLFNSRQKLSLITFAKKVREAGRKLETAEDTEKHGGDEEYEKAVQSYFAFLISRQADYNSSLCVWAVAGEFIAHTFGRQALPMIWDYFELCPWSEATGDWNSASEWIARVIEHCSNVCRGKSMSSVVNTNIKNSSATSLPHPDNHFDAVFTDPPYYDNVPYSYLSDFFYVWLKRTLGDIYPDLFITPLTPKKDEIVAYSNGPGGFEEGKKFFEDMLQKAFREMFRVLKPDGIASIVYAHKSTSGWETLINSLLDSGLVVTSAWPMRTEMESRLRASESAALASSISIVARKMQRQPTAFYNNVKEELQKHLAAKLNRLWEEGIGGADFFIAAIGSAIEVFGKYEKVMDYEGNIIRADKLLEDVSRIATDYAVKQILHNGFAAEISNLTRFYVLFRWEYGTAKVPFDEANKMARSCGIELSDFWNTQGCVKKMSEFIKVLGPHERNLEVIQQSKELVDVLHHVLLLWEQGKRDEMKVRLADTGFGRSEAFYRVAQAISETLPNEDKEKKLLDGFLSGREKLKEEMRTVRKPKDGTEKKEKDHNTGQITTYVAIQETIGN